MSFTGQDLAHGYESHAEALMRALPDGLLLSDGQGRIIEVNDALCTMMGYDRDEIVGLQPPYPWWPEEQVAEITEKFATSMTERSARWELTFERRDGRRFPASVTSSALAVGDGVAGFASVLRDTTGEHCERERLRAAEARLRQAQRMADIGSFEGDYRTGEARWSEELFHLLGLPPRQDPQTLAEARARLADPDGRHLMEVADATRADGEPRELVHRYRRGDEVRIAEMRIEALTDQHGECYGVRGTMQDVTERSRAQAEIHLQAHLLDAVDVTVVATDLAGIITHWNHGAQRALGWDPGDAIGRPLIELTAVAGQLGTTADVLDEIRRAGQWEGELEVSRRDGTRFPGYVRASLFHDLDGARAGIVGVCVDVSTQIETERRLRAASDYQRAITDNMGEGLYTLDVEGRLMYLNRAGEELLGWRSFELEGEVMHDITRGPRLDGIAVRSDEHVFVRRDETELPVEVTAAPFQTADGVRGTVVVFQDITERKERERELERQLEQVSWIGRLRAALAEDRFELHAQPIVDLATGATVQHELLIRLRDEDGTLVAPGQFLPTAERFGLIGEIDQWVTKQGIGHAACGHPVELNLSAQSLGDPDLLNLIRAELRRTGADPALVAFEITETALVQDAAAAEAFITRLRELGCRVALDDFGTGYGGFTYLKCLPITDLKIDIEFVRDLTESHASQEVVRAVVSLARGFGQQTVAEGVEDRATMDLLRELGVDRAQGFAIARPAPVADVFRSV
ncbi:MAG: EAL domain-containing protein [Solirubrobacteraceae bacterium]|nr:EAL domain-containing protein [Solirubrobacteraceae bacterium]